MARKLNPMINRSIGALPKTSKKEMVPSKAVSAIRVKFQNAEILAIFKKFYHEISKRKLEPVNEFEMEHQLWMQCLGIIKNSKQYQKNVYIDEHMWGNKFGSQTKFIQKTHSKILQTQGDAMRRVISRQWKNLEPSINSDKLCIFLLSSEVLLEKKQVCQGAVLVVKKNDNNDPMYFYYETSAPQLINDFAPMKFVVDLKDLPKYNQLEVLFGRQKSTANCFHYCVDFVFQLATEVLQLDVGNITYPFDK